MKRTIICFFAVILILTGCNKAASDKSKEEKETTNVCLLNIEQEGAGKSADQTYLLFEKPDNIMISEGEIEQIKTINSIDYIEMYGIINKINYYYQNGVDYTDENDKFTPLDNTNYMKSCRMLTKEELQTGVLPQKSDEIVLYSSDTDILGQTLTVYFYDRNMLDKTDKYEDYAINYWHSDGGGEDFNYGQYCIKREFKITGLLKKQETQIYFSEEFCKMMGTVFANFPYVDSIYRPFLSDTGIGMDFIDGTFGKNGTVKIVPSYDSASDYYPYNEYEWPKDCDIMISPYREHKCIIVFNDTLKPDEMRISQRMINKYQANSSDELTYNYKIYNILDIRYQVPSVSGNTPICWKPDNLSLLEESYIGFTRENHYHLYYTLFSLSETTHNSGAYIIEVGKEIFDRFYSYNGSRIMSVYPENEAEAENITNMLEAMGYQLYHKRTFAEIRNELYDYWSRTYINEDGIRISEGSPLP
ncbi:MAG: hypothetical protein K1W19_04875 [Lachnospiraceae bacterium]